MFGRQVEVAVTASESNFKVIVDIVISENGVQTELEVAQRGQQ